MFIGGQRSPAWIPVSAGMTSRKDGKDRDGEPEVRKGIRKWWKMKTDKDEGEAGITAGWDREGRRGFSGSVVGAKIFRPYERGDSSRRRSGESGRARQDDGKEVAYSFPRLPNPLPGERGRKRGPPTTPQHPEKGNLRCSRNEPRFAPAMKSLIFAGCSAHPRRGGRVRLIAHDSKSCIPSGIGGSNPPLSVLPRLPHSR